MDDELDLTAFRGLSQAGRAALAEGQANHAVELLGRALALWRGAAAEDVERSAALDRCLGALDEQRLVAVEDWIDAKQRLGEGGSLIAELRSLVDEHPLRERLWSSLVLALYRSGDVAGALTVFGHARRSLAEHLGVDPGPELTRLHHAVLRRDPALDGVRDAGTAVRVAPVITSAAPLSPVGAPATVPPAGGAVAVAPQALVTVPRELPADTAPLVGRDRELAAIEAILSGYRRAGAVYPPLDGPVFIGVHGPAGVGKSALAVQAATRLSRYFPDGQLYADLRGSAPGREPRRPVDVLAGFLRSLGVPEPWTPFCEEEAAARYRSTVANRRLLVLLDDAADEAQVRPLLTATAGSAVLFTGRRQLAAHDRVVHVELGLLDLDHSVELLARLCGAAGPQRQFSRLARECGGSPVALRGAAARAMRR
ncbi:BTAD domain-containing putative transcriptional regulator [Dactylosporangium sp. NPDC000555]|uniref:BTAD domain-containing putative transcriptional regulator n=1 Tax=Dactylosporangium sp. NPDC000555 TaxID=3154260 RepID=UPI0033294FCF